ncbi:MAG: protein jag [Ruminococcaceae bacterium]|nr:protein jag [Oscillospiraceae bacterium]
MNSVEMSGKTVDLAIKSALEELNVDIDDVKIEIIDTPSKGVFGLGSKLAKVRVTVKTDDDEEIATSEEPVEVKETPAPVKKTVKRETECTEADVNNAVEFLNGLFELAGIDVKAEGKIESFEEGDAVSVDITGANTGLVIGKRGETITALQHLASLALARKSDKAPKVYLDSENYREKRIEALKALSNRVANNVVKSRRSFTFEPMTAYERRVIHATLQSNDKVTTYSVGQGIHRKVVVALKK